MSYFSPRVSSTSNTAPLSACAKTITRSLNSLRHTSETSGLHTAYDMTGRAVWQARGQLGETLTFLPSAAGVYAIQDASGCTQVAAW